MRWLYLLALFPFLASAEELKQKEDDIESRLKRLELDAGIVPRQERTSFNVWGDFLYWKASLDGVAYATTAVVVPQVGGGTAFNAFKARTVHFEYDPGFQIGMGVGLPYDHWDVGARWLRFYSTGHDTAEGAPTEAVGNRVIFDTVGAIMALPSPPSRATAHCAVHLNLLDVVLGRTFLWSRFFSFRPFGGVRGVWLNLDWDVSYTTPSATPLPSAKYAIDNRFNAAGVVAGLESKWNLYQGFGLFSYATASLIYGNSVEKTKEKFSLIVKQSFFARNGAHTVKGVFDIAVGLKWETDIYKHLHFLMHAGYDFFYWPSVTQKTIFQNTRTRDRSDLSFQGLLAGARIDF